MKKYVILLLMLFLLGSSAFGADVKLAWKFDGNANDSSGQSLNGTLWRYSTSYTYPTFGEGVPGLPTAIYGDQSGNQAMIVSGYNCAYRTSISTSLLPVAGSASWSMNIWVKPDDEPTEWNILYTLGAKPGGTSTSRAVYSNASGYITFTGGGGEGDRFLVTDELFDVGVWQMVTTTYDGTTVRVYKNADLIGSKDMTFTDAAGEVRVPTWPGWGPEAMSGALDEYMIWSGELTQEEITAMLPEPGTIVLLGLGVLGLFRRR